MMKKVAVVGRITDTVVLYVFPKAATVYGALAATTPVAYHQ